MRGDSDAELRDMLGSNAAAPIPALFGTPPTQNSPLLGASHSTDFIGVH